MQRHEVECHSLCGFEVTRKIKQLRVEGDTCDANGDDNFYTIAVLYRKSLMKRSSAVTVIADCTAYDVRHAYAYVHVSGKLSNRFQLQVYERLVRTIRFNGYIVVYGRTQTLSTQP